MTNSKPDRSPVSQGYEPEPNLESEEAHTPRELRRREEPLRANPLTVVAVVLIVVAAIGLMGIVIWLEISGRFSDSRQGIVNGGKVAGSPQQKPTTKPAKSALLDKAIAALSDPDEVRGLIDRASRADRDAALTAAARMMVATDSPSEAVSARTLMQTLLGCPSASSACQDAAVTAMIGELGSLMPQGKISAWPANRAMSLLTETLLLNEVATASADDPEAVGRLLDRCKQSWADSLRTAPDDPVNDPIRLAAAVAGGGSLVLYARRADAKHFDALAAVLATMAAYPHRSGSAPALAALASAVADRNFPSEMGKIAGLALAEAIRHAPDAPAAERVAAALTDAMKRRGTNFEIETKLDSTAARSQVADAVRAALLAKPATNPAPVATRGVQPGPLSAVLAFSVRGTWSNTNADADLLADLTTTMLACAALTEKITLTTDALDRELETVLAQRNQAARAARLTRGVVLAEGVIAQAVNTPMGLDPNVADDLRKALRYGNMGVKLQAVDRLAKLGDPASGEVLLDRLSQIAKGRNKTDLVLANRILAALKKIDDPRIPARLAALIEPTTYNELAHSIVMTLLDGTGTAGSTDRIDYVLPLTHTRTQRKAAAANWKAIAPTLGWGPGEMLRALGTSKPPVVAWQPDPLTEKLLAAFAHYADNVGRMFKAYKASASPGPGSVPTTGPRPPAPGAGSPANNVPAPITSDELAASAGTLADELIRLARAGDTDGKHAAELDTIEFDERARLAASRTALQATAVRLDSAGRALEILVRQADPSPATGAALDKLRSAHDGVVAATTNVLDELRECAFHDLVLLEQLVPADRR